MKALTLAIFVSSQAFAATSSLTPSQPLRQGHVHGEISKTTYPAQQPGFPTQVKVCDVDKDVPLYDVQGPHESQALENVALCDSTMAGKAIKVQLSAKLGFTKVAGRNEQKSAEVILMAYSMDDSTMMVQTGASGSDDLKVKSLSLSMGGATVTGPDSPQVTETFDTNLTFTDPNP